MSLYQELRLGREIAEREKADAARDQAIEREYRKLVRKLLRVVVTMEEIGESNMGVLHRHYATVYHRITNDLRSLTVDLVNDALPPHAIGRFACKDYKGQGIRNKGSK